MATRFIQSVADTTERDLIPRVPNAAAVVYRKDLGALDMTPPGATAAWQPVPGALTSVQTARVTLTTAQANAGATLLPAIPGFRYRLVDFAMIAIGGNAATATSVRIRATQAASVVSLAIVAVAALTRSTWVKPNSSNVTMLADGAAGAPNDANTAVTLDVDNNNLATATGVHVVIQYVLEAA